MAKRVLQMVGIRRTLRPGPFDPILKVMLDGQGHLRRRNSRYHVYLLQSRAVPTPVYAGEDAYRQSGFGALYRPPCYALIYLLPAHRAFSPAGAPRPPPGSLGANAYPMPTSRSRRPNQ